MRIFAARTIILLFFITIIVVATPVSAVTQTKNGSVDVSGLVPGPPPATPPTIDAPLQNVTFAQKTIDVKGLCINGLVVRIFRNAVFAGSAYCQPDGTYALQIDLMEGRNDLIARQYDNLNQSSPDSDTVSVFYVPPAQQPQLPGETPTSPTAPSTPAPSSPAPPSASGPVQIAQFQLVIDYDYSFQGVAVNRPFHLPIHFLGGTGPYAVSVIWGDGAQSVISRENAEQFFADHVYTKAGIYIVKISVSDKNGATAFLQFALLVSGKVVADVPNVLGMPFSWGAWPNIVLLLACGIAIGVALAMLRVRSRRFRSAKSKSK